MTLLIIMTLSIMILGLTTVSIMTISITTLSAYGTHVDHKDVTLGITPLNILTLR